MVTPPPPPDVPPQTAANITDPDPITKTFSQQLLDLNGSSFFIPKHKAGGEESRKKSEVNKGGVNRERGVTDSRETGLLGYVDPRLRGRDICDGFNSQPLAHSGRPVCSSLLLSNSMFLYWFFPFIFQAVSCGNEWRTFLKIAAILPLIASCPSQIHMTSWMSDRLQPGNEEGDDRNGLGTLALGLLGDSSTFTAAVFSQTKDS